MIILTYIEPPGPVPAYWTAHFAGAQEPTDPMGTGPTPEAAEEDLMDRVAEAQS